MKPRTFKSRKKQQGFIFQASMLAAAIFLSYFTLQYLAIRTDELEQSSDKAQGQKIATYMHALKNASVITESVEEFDTVGAPFQNGQVHIGTNWLKPTTCGGTQTSDFLFCDFENQPSIGDDMQYRTSIINDGTEMQIEVEISNSSRSRGFDFGGNHTTGRSCRIARIAAGGLVDASFNGALSQVDCDAIDTGIITMQVRYNSASSDFISRSGLNSPTTAIPWDGQNIDDMNQLEVSSVIDRDDNSFILDLSGNSIINEMEASKAVIQEADISEVNGDNLQYTNGIISNLSSEAATINRSITQNDSTVLNTFAGGIKSGVDGNTVSLESGSVYLSGSLVDETDQSMFLTPGGISRTQDIRLTSRGDTLISSLLPNYVNKGAVLIQGQGIVNKPNCPDGAGYNAARIIIQKQNEINGIGRGLELQNDYSYNRVRISSTATQWAVRLRTFDYRTGEWDDTNSNNSAVASIYCYYP